MSKTAFTPEHRLAICPQCENLFTYTYTGRRGQRFCGIGCARKFHQKPGALVVRVEVPCEHCGGLFLRGAASSHRRFCGVSCRTVSRRLKETPEAAVRRKACARKSEKRPERKSYIKAKKRRRRALLKGVCAELFTPESIHDRDAWRCQLCRCKVKVTGNSRDPRQATIDHIIPLSKGGPHSPSNCQTACRRCNTEKSIKAIGQFRLF